MRRAVDRDSLADRAVALVDRGGAYSRQHARRAGLRGRRAAGAVVVRGARRELHVAELGAVRGLVVPRARRTLVATSSAWPGGGRAARDGGVRDVVPAQTRGRRGGTRGARAGARAATRRRPVLRRGERGAVRGVALGGRRGQVLHTCSIMCIKIQALKPVRGEQKKRKDLA